MILGPRVSWQRELQPEAPRTAENRNGSPNLNRRCPEFRDLLAEGALQRRKRLHQPLNFRAIVEIGRRDTKSSVAYGNVDAGLTQAIYDRS